MMQWNSKSVLSLALGLSMVCGIAAADTDSATSSPVVMVCKHGAVKRLLAVKLFDQEASARGLELRAISRGLEPYEAVPGKIADALARDGFDVSDFDPSKLSKQEVAESLRVVSIGADLSEFRDEATSAILQWDDVPPASVDYQASKAAILAHVRALLDELEDAPQ
ncbi:MAG: hypothetical protein AAF657_10095 [Acidobacteriota bacterium]